MNYLKKHRKIILAAISLVLFIIVAKTALVDDLVFYDKVAQDIVNSVRCDALTVIMKLFSFACSVEVLLFICVLTFILGKDKKKASLISINLIINYLLNTLAKYIVQRPRPDEVLRLIEEHGYSFPSGHSMVSMAFYGYIVYLIYKHVDNKPKKYIACFSLLFLIAMIGISRIYLGVHYASDVLAGFLLSVAYLMLFVIFSPKVLDFINKRLKNEKEEKTKKKN
jgi:undecaprenyl-diphosphatase